MKIRPGERVVFDANVLIDYVLSPFAPEKPSDRWGAKNEEAARAAKSLVAGCCVVCNSKKLVNEAVSNQNKRGLPVPRITFVQRLLDLENRKKLVDFTRSKLASVSLTPAERKRLPPEDIHVAQLAKAASARLILTRDGPLEGSAALGGEEGIPIVSPEWVLGNAALEESCGG